MKERGILFSGAMVRALLAGAKTQTRRVVKPQPRQGAGYPFAQRDDWAWQHTPNHAIITADPATSDSMPSLCPYGVPGDRLWVRETWALDPFVGDVKLACHRATAIDGPSIRWRPSIYMPRWASRITLEVTEVRVQRVQDITEADARAEGVEAAPNPPSATPVYRGRDGEVFHLALEAFPGLWDSINGTRAPWASNPWCWAVSFRRLP